METTLLVQLSPPPPRKNKQTNKKLMAVLRVQKILHPCENGGKKPHRYHNIPLVWGFPGRGHRGKTAAHPLAPPLYIIQAVTTLRHHKIDAI